MAKKGKAQAKDASNEYRSLCKMGFISLEEVDAEEAQAVLANFAPDSKARARSARRLRATKVISTGAAQGASDAAGEDGSGDRPGTWTEPIELKGWSDVFPALHPALLKAVSELGFSSPTSVQSRALNVLLNPQDRKDVLGSAPTGSGKTLAFLLPILNHYLLSPGPSRPPLMMSDPSPTDDPSLTTKDGISAPAAPPPTAPSAARLLALLIAPTRELAMQIESHLRQLTKFIPALRSVVLVGGMSQERQERLLARGPPIIIGTPGRLAEVFGTDNALQARLTNLEFLVLDEADRLSETGHFRDLDMILELLQKYSGRRHRNFVFSATLASKAIGTLKRKLHFRSKNPHVITDAPAVASSTGDDVGAAAAVVAPSSGLGFVCPSTLQHYSLYCLDQDKIGHLYALLWGGSGGGPLSAASAAHPPRTLVFVNAISLTKELATTLALLGIPCASLHAQMPQKQRMKVLDRFRQGQLSVLVTSDVAARGLDIPSVAIVVHYHIPHTLDIFIHRSGRTARANQTGTSVALVAPHESAQFGRLISTARLAIKEYPVDMSRRAAYGGKAAILAQKIAKLETQQSRRLREQSWEERAAEALGVDLDDDGSRSSKRSLDDDDGPPSGEQVKRLKIAQLKQELAQLLPRAPTTGSRRPQ